MKKNICNILREHADSANRDNRFFIALYGSQNYQLDTENSDVDSKMLVIPTLDDLIRGTMVSYEYIMDNGEHCDVKDIRKMFQCFKKQNINYLEILFTDYYLVEAEYFSYFSRLREIREDIARYNNHTMMKCLFGMSQQKADTMIRMTPSTKENILKYGYDGKSLSHLLRIENLLDAYIRDFSFKVCLRYFGTHSKETIIAAKHSSYTRDMALALRNNSLDRIEEKTNSYISSHSKTVNDKVDKELDNIAYSIIHKQLKERSN